MKKTTFGKKVMIYKTLRQGEACRRMNDTELPIDIGEMPQGDLPLEEKYRGQMRQIVAQKIELPISTLPMMIENQIELAPDFQRRDRWDVRMQSRFIESIIMNVPVPPVFLGEDQYGKYVVLDGRQRLTALFDFMRGVYALKGLAVWNELNGLRYADLQRKKLDVAITRRFVPAVVILKESSNEVKYDVFDRLNTGGEQALPMEIRNAVFRGAFTSLLHTLSDDNTFRRLWEIPEKDDERQDSQVYNTMVDLELVLRFFATRDYDRMHLSFKDYLSEYLKTKNSEYAENPSNKDADTALFHRAVENCWLVFGEDAFRRPESRRKSAPVADAIMAALCDVPSEQLTATIIAEIKAAFHEIMTSDTEFQKAMGTGTNGKGAIKIRIDLARETVRRILKN